MNSQQEESMEFEKSPLDVMTPNELKGAIKYLDIMGNAILDYNYLSTKTMTPPDLVAFLQFNADLLKEALDAKSK